MKKNFSKQPNDFLLDEKQEHNLTAYIKSPLQKLIIIVMDGCSNRFNGEFQKSANQLAKMCMVTRKTFNDNIDILINQGLISKRIVNVEGKKEKEATYWTVNFEFKFEEMEDENENNTTLDKNYTTVGENLYNGGIEFIQKEDVLKDSLKDLNNSVIYNARQLALIEYYKTTSETIYMQDFLMNKGFSGAIIKDIINLIAIKCMDKTLNNMFLKSNEILKNAVAKYNAQVNIPNAKFFVIKLTQEIDLYNIKRIENEEKLKAYEEGLN